jgi:hypothetical protein
MNVIELLVDVIHYGTPGGVGSIHASTYSATE